MILQHHARFQMYVRAGFRYVGVCAIQLCTLGWKGSCETVHGTFWDSVNSVNFRLFLLHKHRPWPSCVADTTTASARDSEHMGARQPARQVGSHL